MFIQIYNINRHEYNNTNQRSIKDAPLGKAGPGTNVSM